MDARKETKEKYKKWVYLLEEVLWSQISWEVWLKEGNENTRFFHEMANTNWRRSSMARVKIDGIWMIEKVEIKDGVVGQFRTY